MSSPKQVPVSVETNEKLDEIVKERQKSEFMKVTKIGVVAELIAACYKKECANKNPYGFCPICGNPGVTRERRLDGNDTCSNGHTYKSSSACEVKK